ncbi:hypothetical protein SLA2020_328550 [Shorea laevis]
MDEYVGEVIPLICHPSSQIDQHQFKQTEVVKATFLAIKNGIPEIVNEIKRAHANVSWSSSDPEGSGNMFACAVAHRQEKVAQIIYGSMDTNLLTSTDQDAKNALHIAAKLAPHSQLGCISGAALQLQSEVRWFKLVEGIVLRFCKEYKNEKDETPFQVFAEEHKNLLKEAEEWIKKTAESSTVVGALIITITFAAAFTVPGGNEQNSGYPIFLPKKPIPFMVFIVSDAISLFTASSSVLVFLGVLTSRYAYNDFLKSLPIKLIIGLSSLFISIATMTTAFCAALFIMLRGRLEVITPITLLACIPIAFFGWLQFPLLIEIYTSTFRRDIFEKEKESFLESWLSLFCELTIGILMSLME